MTASDPAGPTPPQHAHMHALWAAAKVTDRAARLALTTAATGREITTSSDLTRAEAARLIDYMVSLDRAGVLAERAAEHLDGIAPPPATPAVSHARAAHPGDQPLPLFGELP